MKHNLWLIFIFITLLPLSIQGNENLPVDNLTILDQLTEQIIQQAINNITFDKSNKIIVKNAIDDDKNSWYIENWFIKVLNERGHNSVVLDRFKNSKSISDSVAAIIFEFKTKQLGVQYTEDSSFWHTKPINRLIFVALEIKVIDFNNGLIYWTGDTRKDHSDKIKKDQIPALQNSNILFTQAPIPPPTGYKKLFEPIFIMGVTGTIIYLFYSFRSK